MGETEFLAEMTRRTGCGLLLDVNNVFVSAANHGFDPFAYLAGFPLDAVGEIHLAGYADDEDDSGLPLLIDAHDSPVREAVWTLYAHAIRLIGPKPTLVEWDNDLPDWPALHAEAERAKGVMTGRFGRPGGARPCLRRQSPPSPPRSPIRPRLRLKTRAGGARRRTGGASRSTATMSRPGSSARSRRAIRSTRRIAGADGFRVAARAFVAGAQAALGGADRLWRRLPGFPGRTARSWPFRPCRPGAARKRLGRGLSRRRGRSRDPRRSRGARSRRPAEGARRLSPGGAALELSRPRPPRSGPRISTAPTVRRRGRRAARTPSSRAPERM